jgi:polar amino acid transport system substrate-binding protein
MQKSRRILAALVLAAAVSSHAGETITVVADLWCPYNCVPGSAKEGIALDILRRSLEGVEIQYQLMDWDQAIVRSRAGEFDAIVGAAHSDAPDFVFPAKSFAFTRNCLYAPSKSAWKFSGYAELSKIRLGAIKSYTYGKPVDDYIAGASADKMLIAEGEAPLNDLIAALDAGKIDVLVSDKNVFSYTANELGKRDAYRMEGCGEQDDIYIAFSPANKERAQKLADKVTAAIEDLQKKHLMPAIYSRYSGH